MQKSDLYRLMAADVFAKPPAQVTQDERRTAKTVRAMHTRHRHVPMRDCGVLSFGGVQVCLGIMYGIGAVEASKKLGVTEAEAKGLKQRFLARYMRITCCFRIVATWRHHAPCGVYPQLPSSARLHGEREVIRAAAWWAAESCLLPA